VRIEAKLGTNNANRIKPTIRVRRGGAIGDSVNRLRRFSLFAVVAFLEKLIALNVSSPLSPVSIFPESEGWLIPVREGLGKRCFSQPNNKTGF